MMGVMRDLEIVWEDLLDAFENDSDDLAYFLDRSTGEVFFVPAQYEDESFWDEVEGNPDNFLQIPGFDHEQERLLIHEFTRRIDNEELKQLLQAAVSGRPPFGRFDDILAFYPEELEKLAELKDALTADRIRHWLEEHDIYTSEKDF